MNLMQEHLNLANNVKVCSHVVAKRVEFHCLSGQKSVLVERVGSLENDL